MNNVISTGQPSSREPTALVGALGVNACACAAIALIHTRTSVVSNPGSHDDAVVPIAILVACLLLPAVILVAGLLLRAGSPLTVLPIVYPLPWPQRVLAPLLLFAVFPASIGFALSTVVAPPLRVPVADVVAVAAGLLLFVFALARADLAIEPSRVTTKSALGGGVGARALSRTPQYVIAVGVFTTAFVALAILPALARMGVAFGAAAREGRVLSIALSTALFASVLLFVVGPGFRRTRSLDRRARPVGWMLGAIILGLALFSFYWITTRATT